MRKSKIGRYEIPYSVKGTIKQVGLKWKPKGICTDKITGTWKASNEEKITVYDTLLRKT